MGVNPLALLEGTMVMEGVGVPSLWGYNDCNEELHQTLIDTQWELLSFQAHAREELKKKDEELKKSEEHIQKLLLLLKATSKERDEAREQLQLLLSNVRLPMLPNAVAEPCSPHQVWQGKGNNNSSSTESNSVSDTRNHGHSYVSSPVESFFDAEASPELPNKNIADSFHHHIAVAQKPIYNHNIAGISKYDQASARLEQLASKRPLPEKGKLMDAVMKAGPLLHSLLVAGPLPRWKNPPPLQQLQIPPVSVKARNSQTLNQTAALSPNPLAQNNRNGLHAETLMHGIPMKTTAMVSPCAGAFVCLPVKRHRSQ